MEISILDLSAFGLYLALQATQPTHHHHHHHHHSMVHFPVEEMSLIIYILIESIGKHIDKILSYGQLFQVRHII